MSRLRLQASPCNTGQALQVERDKGVHFDREEAAKLRDLAEYCMRGFMGEHAHTVKMIMAKVPR